MIFLVLGMVSCAKQGTLSGGPKDLDPPRLDTIKSERNYQTNYFPKTIFLYFDEWIQLKNSSQILISPPLQTNPVIKSKGKYVQLIFDEKEVLRDSTTYSINFGSAITDFTEANPVTNFQFIFSTGDKIDSLNLQGKVIDSYTKKPVDKVTVMLYDLDIDSLVYQEKPYYFSKTDKEGNFIIKHMRKGLYKCFALLDANYDFLYNQETEQIGFLDSMFLVKPDSFVQKISLELFLPTPKISLADFSMPVRGKIKIKTNRDFEDFKIEYSNRPYIEQENLGDSVIVWFEPKVESNDSIFLAIETESLKDTIILKSKTSTNTMGLVRFSSFKQRKKSFMARDSLGLIFNQILKNIDTSFMDLIPLSKRPVLDSIDTLKPPVIPTIDFDYEIDSLNKRQMVIRAKWSENEKYELVMYPGALEGYFQTTNDTIKTEIEMLTIEDVGSIICRFDSLDENSQYIVFLKIKDKIIREHVISKQKSKELTYKYLDPGKYLLEIIEDVNMNGRWDPGNYNEKRQSERKRVVSLEELRKNWDIETEIKWDDK